MAICVTLGQALCALTVPGPGYTLQWLLPQIVVYFQENLVLMPYWQSLWLYAKQVLLTRYGTFTMTDLSINNANDLIWHTFCHSCNVSALTIIMQIFATYFWIWILQIWPLARTHDKQSQLVHMIAGTITIKIAMDVVMILYCVVTIAISDLLAFKWCVCSH